MADVLEIKDQVEDSFTGEELPEQFSATPTIFPGINLFLLPANLDQCWSTFDVEKRDTAGNPILDAEGKPVVEQHLMLKFGPDAPLVVRGGDYDGLPVHTTISTLARKRGKKNDPNAPSVADLTYLLRTCLADRTVITKRADWVPAVNKHAGGVIRLEHGLSGYCDPERVRYIDDGTGRSIEDPDGTMGCGKTAGGDKPKTRLYSQDYKIKVWSEEEQKEILAWTDTVTCKTCGARVRGFFRIERFLPPLASAQQVG